MTLKPATVAILLLLGCTTGQTPAPAAPQSEFKNLRILPHTITRPELIATMRSFTRALGVRCNHCHVVTATEPREQHDFPSDAKEEKRVARVMMQMTGQINGAWMERVEEAEGHEEEAAPSAAPQQRVGCWTCHRGKTEPELPPPPPPDPAPGR
ncbi:MAG TPA: c-type cytochrome [Thermoanaerobaculia bacterium]|nr:c-type cytochrome [Thermoanaerobaculia bacterium]